jgi:5-methylcytosine-specific restriction enzyme subunit McrC
MTGVASSGSSLPVMAVTSRSELAHLAEGQVLEAVDLSRAEAAALNATSLVSVQPSTDGWRVTAAHAVGALRCGDLRVRVRPKVGQLQVLRLLARAYGLSGLTVDESLVGVATDPDLTAVLATLFAHEAATALAAGSRCAATGPKIRA